MKKNECGCPENKWCRGCCPEMFEGEEFELGRFVGTQEARLEVAELIRFWREDEECFAYEIDAGEACYQRLCDLEKRLKKNIPDEAIL